jgi:hypothetical protein
MRTDLIEKLANFFVKEAKKYFFNKKDFNALRTYQQRKRYLQLSETPIMGEGSSRVVYMMSPRKALKLAKNQPGVAQNQFEYYVIQKSNSDLFPKFYDKAPDDSWLELEMCRPITVQEFQDKTGIHVGIWTYMMDKLGPLEPTIAKRQLIDFLESKTGRDFENLFNKELTFEMLNKIFEKNKITSIKALSYMHYVCNPVAIKIANIVREFNMPAVEISRIATWGTTADGRLVFIDAGYNDNIGWNYYEKDDEVSSEDLPTEIPDGLSNKNENILDYNYPVNLSKDEEEKKLVDVFLSGEKRTVKPKTVSVPNMPEFISKDPKNVLE